MVEKGYAKIRIVNCNDELWGVVAWEQKAGVDHNNPDPSKRARPTLGMPVLIAMKPTKPNRWEGEIYNSEDGKTYTSHISLASPDVLQVRGCVLGFLCGGEDWTRVTDEQQSAASARGEAGPRPAPPTAPRQAPPPAHPNAGKPSSRRAPAPIDVRDRIARGRLPSTASRRSGPLDSRGAPISAGWNSTAAHIVHTSDSARSLPMLDVPGWLDSHRLPKAVAVVSALQITARVSADCNRLVCPDRHAMM